jgi:hypothetical protein
MNSTRQNFKAQHMAKVVRTAAERRDRQWQRREEERRKAAKNGPTTPAVRRSGTGPVDSTSSAPATA